MSSGHVVSSAPFLVLPARSGGDVDRVFHAARIQDLATAARHRDGHLDLVGMTRAHMADPHIASNYSGGSGGRDPSMRRRRLLHRLHLRRPGALHPQCRDGARGYHAACGRARAHRADSRRGRRGPGGLEAARVAAERGHRSSSSRPPRSRAVRSGRGGPRAAARDPRDRRLAHGAMRKHGVDFRINTTRKPTTSSPRTPISW